ncbi:hypothetical protein EVAR_43509_1 [Eumeta japonica]|uniref:Secreted protein n=1 Tax=Eumeta variegata TaxID=151549 RepID=A0A4C1YK00_EUMVA|nr:hypothetical protein EVAR_43509_1 [Eumeta japonica]
MCYKLIIFIHVAFQTKAGACNAHCSFSAVCSEASQPTAVTRFARNYRERADAVPMIPISAWSICKHVASLFMRHKNRFVLCACQMRRTRLGRDFCAVFRGRSVASSCAAAWPFAACGASLSLGASGGGGGARPRPAPAAGEYRASRIREAS